MPDAPRQTTIAERDPPMTENLKIVLRKRPDGLPRRSDFDFVREPVPEPAEGEFLIRHEYVGLSPAARIRMDDRPSYAPPLKLGEVVYAGIAGEVVKSRHPDFRVGDKVNSFGGWQAWSISDGRGAEVWDTAIGTLPNSLGLFGLSGNTAYVGLMGIGDPKPGETVVVSAASGGVGSLVCQMARIKGCRVVGIAGGPEKCAFVTEVLGADACIDHRSPDFAAELAAACPDGVDIDFENVGGPIRDAVLDLMNRHGRVVLCGLIAEYNALATSTGPSWFRILHKCLKVQGFLLRDFPELRQPFLRDMSEWNRSGRIVYREDIRDGLDHTPEVFADMLQGRNFGKTIIRV